MNQRIVEITDMQAHLSLHRGFLKVSIKDNKEYEIPLHDIGGVIANSYSLTYSNNLLVKLAELNIPFINFPASISDLLKKKEMYW